MSSIPLLQPRIPSREAIGEFLERHKQLLALERGAEEEQTRLLNSNCSPRLLEQRGLALNGLGVSAINIGLGGKSLIELHRPSAYHTSPLLPPHTFRNGEPVRIEPHISEGTKKKVKKVDDEDNAVEGVVYRVSREKVVVAVDGGKQLDLPERLRLLKLANSVTFDRMDRTLSHLQRILLPDLTAPISSSHTFNLPLIRSLLSLDQPKWSPKVPAIISSQTSEIVEDEEIQWFDQGLNDSQKEAVRFALTAENVACIHGPPGTGKTHTLIELIFQLLSRPSSNSPHPPRILICTPSNLALDNLLLRLHSLSLSAPYTTHLPKGSILRLGHPTKVHKDLLSQTLDWQTANGEQGGLLKDVGRELEGHLGDLGRKRGEKGAVKGKERGKKWDEVKELRKEYRQRESKVVSSVVNSARVVLSTCHGAGSKQLNNLLFDVCIIDEATQAVEAVCWVPILKSRKLILAGDPQQLPPTILSKNDKILKSSKKSTPVALRADEPLNGATSAAEIGSTVDDKNDSQPKSLGESEDDPPSASDTPDDPALKEKLDDIAERLDSASIAADTTSPSLRPPRTLETTLFDRLERLYGTGIKRVLQVQYRMNEKIAAFPSSELYESNLISSSSVSSRLLLDLPTVVDPKSDESIDCLSHTVVFFDTAGCEFYERSEGDDSASLAGKGKERGIVEGSKCNENEAMVVEKWARRLVDLGVPASEIAIVTPYQAQVSVISSSLHEDFPEMTIGSVDGLQGQEREAIILSLVRSNAKGEVGFLEEYRRLNVAMTRAKRQLCVVGDSSTVGKGSGYLKKWMEWLESEADVRWAGDELL